MAMHLDRPTEDRIRKMYMHRSILITGATGFVGKVLIEKFLRYEYQTLSMTIAIIAI